MTWLAVILVTAPFVALMFWIAHELGQLLAEAGVLDERAAAGECHCTRHRLCWVCLEELRSGREAA